MKMATTPGDGPRGDSPPSPLSLQHATTTAAVSSSTMTAKPSEHEQDDVVVVRVTDDPIVSTETNEHISVDRTPTNVTTSMFHPPPGAHSGGKPKADDVDVDVGEKRGHSDVDAGEALPASLKGSFNEVSLLPHPSSENVHQPQQHVTSVARRPPPGVGATRSILKSSSSTNSLPDVQSSSGRSGEHHLVPSGATTNNTTSPAGKRSPVVTQTDIVIVNDDSDESVGSSSFRSRQWSSTTSAANSPQHRAAAAAVASNRLMKPSRKHWVSNDASPTCMDPACQKEFSVITRRRHHCRRCGGLFCNDCAPPTRLFSAHSLSSVGLHGLYAEVEDNKARFCRHCITRLTELLTIPDPTEECEICAWTGYVRKPPVLPNSSSRGPLSISSDASWLFEVGGTTTTTTTATTTPKMGSPLQKGNPNSSSLPPPMAMDSPPPSLGVSPPDSGARSPLDGSSRSPRTNRIQSNTFAPQDSFASASLNPPIVVLDDCNHRFHADCLRRWQKHNNCTSCPVSCRRLHKDHGFPPSDSTVEEALDPETST